MGMFTVTPQGLWVFQSSLTIQPLYFRARKYTLETQPEFQGALGAWKDGAMTQGRQVVCAPQQEEGKVRSLSRAEPCQAPPASTAHCFSQSHFTLNLP